jgi:hypothetical protein
MECIQGPDSRARKKEDLDVSRRIILKWISEK